MEYSAIYHDMDKRFCYAIDKDLFVIRVQVKKDDMKEIILHCEDKYIPMERKDTKKTILMKKIATSQFHDYYEAQIQMHLICLRYYFEFTDMHGEKIYYGNYEFYKECITNRDRMFDCPQNLREEEMFEVPDWAANKVVYQIFPARFAASQQVDKEQWYKAPISSMDDLHGDLRGIIEHLDHVQNLGIDVLYMTPIFKSYSSHKYDTIDYYQIDPSFGTTEDLRELVQEAHKRGIRVILDGVFNHCGSFNKWLDRERIYENKPGYEKGAYISEDSPYHDYFSFHDNNRFPYNPTYDGWWGHDTLPKLNYEGSRQLEDYILQVARKWVSAPFHADGWRLDVAADLGHSPEYNHRFWTKFRDTVKEANPHALIVAEHYGDPSSWLQGDQWDTVMNYDAFMEPVSWFLTGMEKHSDDYRQDLLGNADSFVGAMAYHGANMAMPSWLTAMNELSNHDHSRFLTRTNRRVGRTNSLGAEAANHDVKKAVLLEAVVMQMTWPGAPTVYYGDEAGVCGFTDPDNRRTYPWGREDKELINFHREIIRIHRQNKEFKTGSLKCLTLDYNFLAYGRFTKNNHSVVLINNNENEITKELSVWELGIPRDCTLQRLILTGERGYDINPMEIEVSAGRITVTMPKTSSMILQYRTEEEEKTVKPKTRQSFWTFG